jgi:SecD-like export protein
MRFSIKFVIQSVLVTLVLAGFALLPVLGCQKSASQNDRPGVAKQKPAGSDIPDGFYLVARLSEQRDELLPLSKSERIVVHDQTFGGIDPEEPAVFLVVADSPQVPLYLSSLPKSGELEEGRKAIQLEFSEDASEKLERFSADNIGGAVAVVVGGKVATRHKIRVAITGGKLQISCCGAGACEHLLRELGDNLVK